MTVYITRHQYYTFTLLNAARNRTGEKKRIHIHRYVGGFSTKGEQTVRSDVQINGHWVHDGRFKWRTRRTHRARIFKFSVYYTWNHIRQFISVLRLQAVHLSHGEGEETRREKKTETDEEEEMNSSSVRCPYFECHRRRLF